MILIIICIYTIFVYNFIIYSHNKITCPQCNKSYVDKDNKIIYKNNIYNKKLNIIICNSKICKSNTIFCIDQYKNFILNGIYINSKKCFIINDNYRSYLYIDTNSIFYYRLDYLQNFLSNRNKLDIKISIIGDTTYDNYSIILNKYYKYKNLY